MEHLRIAAPETVWMVRALLDGWSDHPEDGGHWTELHVTAKGGVESLVRMLDSENRDFERNDDDPYPKTGTAGMKINWARRNGEVEFERWRLLNP